jgi:hypothetical protein
MDGELRIDLAVYEAADNGSPRFALFTVILEIKKCAACILITRILRLIIPGPLRG